MARGATNSLSPEFLEETVTVRGATYKLRELSIGEYDELVAKATTTKTNGVGDETESVDNTLLLKLMVMKCAVDPKLTAETMSLLPMRVMLKINQTVNRMHYGDEPTTVAKNGTSPDTSDEEEPAKGNA